MYCIYFDIGCIWGWLPYSRYAVRLFTDLEVFMNLDCIDKYWSICAMYVYNCMDVVQIDRQRVLLNYDLIIELVTNVVDMCLNFG